MAILTWLRDWGGWALCAVIPVAWWRWERIRGHRRRAAPHGGKRIGHGHCGPSFSSPGSDGESNVATLGGNPK